MGFFSQGSAKHCFHTTLKLEDQGCPTVLARVQVSWLLLLKNPVCLGSRPRKLWYSNSKPVDLTVGTAKSLTWGDEAPERI